MMSGFPACAVPGDDDVGMNSGHVLYGLRDYLFEYSTGEGHSTDEGMNPVYACYPLSSEER